MTSYEGSNLISRIQNIFDNNGESSRKLLVLNNGAKNYAVDVTNVFWWGNDCEIITEENISVLEQAAKDIAAISGNGTYIGVGVLFAARVRAERPMDSFYDYLDPRTHHLFDAAGPVRVHQPNVFIVDRKVAANG